MCSRFTSVVSWATGADAAVDGLGGASALHVQSAHYTAICQQVRKTYNSSIIVRERESLPLARSKERRSRPIIMRARRVDTDRARLGVAAFVQLEEGLVAAGNDFARAATDNGYGEAVDEADVNGGL